MSGHWTSGYREGVREVRRELENPERLLDTNVFARNIEGSKPDHGD
jgi:hypothetical protein